MHRIYPFVSHRAETVSYTHLDVYKRQVGIIAPDSVHGDVFIVEGHGGNDLYILESFGIGSLENLSVLVEGPTDEHHAVAAAIARTAVGEARHADGCLLYTSPA